MIVRAVLHGCIVCGLSCSVYHNVTANRLSTSFQPTSNPPPTHLQSTSNPPPTHLQPTSNPPPSMTRQKGQILGTSTGTYEGQKPKYIGIENFDPIMNKAPTSTSPPGSAIGPMYDQIQHTTTTPTQPHPPPQVSKLLWVVSLSNLR